MLFPRSWFPSKVVTVQAHLTARGDPTVRYAIIMAYGLGSPIGSCLKCPKFNWECKAKSLREVGEARERFPHVASRHANF
jgi:hypothetical protein